MKVIDIFHTSKSVVNQHKMWLAGFLLINFMLSSCKKEELYNGPIYAVTVFNGVDDGVNLYHNFNGGHSINFKLGGQVTNRRAVSSNFLEETVIASFFPSPDTLPKDQPVLKKEFNLKSSGINNLYIMGSKGSIDYFLTSPQYKGYIVGDSVTYLTFVNICNDQPVSLNIKGNPKGSLISQLVYKSASDVIEVPVRLADTRYDIEFRDAVTGDSLTTFVLNNPNPPLNFVNTYLYKNSSIVLVGKRGQLTGLNKLEAVRITL